jgi:hypothetical protein
MSLRSTSLAAVIALSLGTAATHATDLGDTFSVRGYSTAGFVHSDNDDADFVSNSKTQSRGAGFSDQWSYDPDSKLAVQLDASFTPRLSAVVQIVSESAFNNSWDGDANERFNPSLEWANVSYKVTDDLTVRGGRIVLPTLMLSDSRKVGYASHWLRAPVEVYGESAFTSSDGLDLRYNSKHGAAVNDAVAYYGFYSLRSGIKSQVEVWGLSDTVGIGALTVRAGYQNIHFQTPDGFSELLLGFANAAESVPAFVYPNARTAAAEARRMYYQYDPTFRQKLQSFSVGASYDPGSWFAMSELFYNKSDSFLPGGKSGYVSGGVRMNQFTPYMTYSRTETDTRNERGIPLAGLPTTSPIPGMPSLAQFGAIANSVVTGLVNGDASQSTLSVGMRWDAFSGIALKTQYDYINVPSGSRGQFINQQPGFTSGHTNVFSVAVDFVF